LVSDYIIIYINWEKCQALFSFLIIIFSVGGEYLSYNLVSCGSVECNWQLYLCW